MSDLVSVRAEARRRLIDLCSGLPGVAGEEGAEGHVGFKVRGKRFAWLLDDHHGDGRLALNCKAPPGENARLAEEDPERYYLPPYLASRGWAGLWLDLGSADWDRVEGAVVTAYRMSAPKRLAAQLDELE